MPKATPTISALDAGARVVVLRGPNAGKCGVVTRHKSARSPRMLLVQLDDGDLISTLSAAPETTGDRREGYDGEEVVRDVLAAWLDKLTLLRESVDAALATDDPRETRVALENMRELLRPYGPSLSA